MQFQQSVLRQITPEALAILGSMEMAYIRSVKDHRGQQKFAIYSADGQKLGEEDDSDIAMVVARQNDFQPFLVN